MFDVSTAALVKTRERKMSSTLTRERNTTLSYYPSNRTKLLPLYLRNGPVRSHWHHEAPVYFVLMVHAFKPSPKKKKKKKGSERRVYTTIDSYSMTPTDRPPKVIWHEQSFVGETARDLS